MGPGHETCEGQPVAKTGHNHFGIFSPPETNYPHLILCILKQIPCHYLAFPWCVCLLQILCQTCLLAEAFREKVSFKRTPGEYLQKAPAEFVAASLHTRNQILRPLIFLQKTNKCHVMTCAQSRQVKIWMEIRKHSPMNISTSGMWSKLSGQVTVIKGERTVS